MPEINPDLTVSNCLGSAGIVHKAHPYSVRVEGGMVLLVRCKGGH